MQIVKEQVNVCIENGPPTGCGGGWCVVLGVEGGNFEVEEAGGEEEGKLGMLRPG